MTDKQIFICDQCGNEFSKWYGQCPACQAWNSLKSIPSHTKTVGGRKVNNSKIKLTITKASQVFESNVNRVATNIGEVDRVLGGGIVPGSLILLAGQPGIGKSTLASQIGLNLSRQQPILYLAGEENPPQIKLRLKRLSRTIPDNFWFAAETKVEVLMALDKLKTKPCLIIIDSIQTMSTDLVGTQAGSPSQIKLAANLLMQIAKKNNLPIIIIGHVTKEGSIAGPKLLEHMVDTVIQFEGDANHAYRILRAVKNRFGTTNEIGLFTMEANGLKQVDNPLSLFSSELETPIPGSATSVIMEGERPILVEIQALVNPSNLTIPRRVAQGIASNKLIMLSAIISRRLGLSLANYDVFVNVTGGLNIKEPAVDLATTLAIISAYKQKAIPTKTATFGEVGLLGEVRPASFWQRRAKEAKRLGFNQTLATKPTLLKTVVKNLF